MQGRRKAGLGHQIGCLRQSLGVSAEINEKT